MELALATALFDWLVGRVADGVLDRTLLSDGKSLRRALRRVVEIAVPAAAEAVVPEDEPEARAGLIRALLEGPIQPPRLDAARDLTAVVAGWVERLNLPADEGWKGCLDDTGVRPDDLTRALADQIFLGIEQDALENGPLRGLAQQEQFRRLAASNERQERDLELVLGLVSHLVGDERGGAGAVFTASHDGALDPFRALIEERTHSFTGRDHVVDKVFAALRDPDMPSGYVLVRGEPGIGKTALLAHLVRQHGLVHHFNIRQEGVVTAQAFLDGVCRQIAARYCPDVAYRPPRPDQGGAALTGWLQRALDRADRRGIDIRPLVIAVDALDEAERPRAGANVLLLPPTLPRGVYVVATSREVDLNLQLNLQVDLLRTISMKDATLQNLGDVRAYLTARLDSLLPERLPERGSVSALVDVLTELSEGNFMYAVHMSGDILAGRRAVTDATTSKNLPRGLEQYYESHWALMHDLWPSDLRRAFDAAVTSLAVLREPLTLVQLSELAPDEHATPAFCRTVVAHMRQFLNERRRPSSAFPDPLRDITYSIYHASFVDFLERAGAGLEPARHELHRTSMNIWNQFKNQD